MRKTYKSDILKEMSEVEKGTIFCNSDFLSLASPNVVSKALDRLVKEKEIIRLINGYYCIPKYSNLIDEYVYPAADKLAAKIAEKYNWTMIPDGLYALNMVGISTQVVNTFTYISDGPYKKYKYLNWIINYKHTSNHYIKDIPNKIAVIIQVLKELGKENNDEVTMHRIANYLNDVSLKEINKYASKITNWIYRYMVKAKELNYAENFK